MNLKQRFAVRAATAILWMGGLTPVYDLRIVKPDRKRDTPGRLVRRFHKPLQSMKMLTSVTDIAACAIRGDLSSQLELRVRLHQKPGYIMQPPSAPVIVQGNATTWHPGAGLPKPTARAAGTLITSPAKESHDVRTDDRSADPAADRENPEGAPAHGDQ